MCRSARPRHEAVCSPARCYRRRRTHRLDRFWISGPVRRRIRKPYRLAHATTERVNGIDLGLRPVRPQPEGVFPAAQNNERCSCFCLRRQFDYPRAESHRRSGETEDRVRQRRRPHQREGRSQCECVPNVAARPVGCSPRERRRYPRSYTVNPYRSNRKARRQRRLNALIAKRSA